MHYFKGENIAGVHYFKFNGANHVLHICFDDKDKNIMINTIENNGDYYHWNEAFDLKKCKEEEFTEAMRKAIWETGIYEYAVSKK